METVIAWTYFQNGLNFLVKNQEVDTPSKRRRRRQQKSKKSRVIDCMIRRMDEDMTKDRHIYRLEADKRALAVWILVIK